MKVLFVGDGKHDVGSSQALGDATWSPRGVIPILACRIVPEINEGVTLTWTDLHRLPIKKRRKGAPTQRGYAAKIRLARMLAMRRYDCDALVAVVDRDRVTDRVDELVRAASEPGDIPVVCGVAIESIESWTLGDQAALAAALGLSSSELSPLYSSAQVEQMCESSGKNERRPKRLLEVVAELAHERDSLELREDVARTCDLQRLSVACPGGFGRFEESLRRLRGTSAAR